MQRQQDTLVDGTKQQISAGPRHKPGSAARTALSNSEQDTLHETPVELRITMQIEALRGVAAKVVHPEAVANDTDIASPENPETMCRELKALPSSQLLHQSGSYVVAIARQLQVPTIVDEIGRLRETSFRAVGEGTGKLRDLDEYDEWYMHLFVWDDDQKQVLGAYRIGMTDVLLKNHGKAALYTASLFSYEPPFLERLGSALEMGRSFVRPEFQRSSRVLALLWKGIGRIIAERPHYSRLFGPVSVSASYSAYSRQLIAAALLQEPYRHPLHELVAPLRPVGSHLLEEPVRSWEPREISRRVSQAEPDGKGLPTLVREYLKLSGQFLAFSTDPDFADAMDGLVTVDLRRTSPRLLKLYMGSEHFERFFLGRTLCRGHG